MSYLEDSIVDVAFFQETWLTKGDNNIYSEMKEYGYNVIKSMRDKNRGGGLAILFKPFLKIKRIHLSSNTKFKTFEHIFCKMSFESSHICLVNFYRLPYSSSHPFSFTIKMFLEEFEVFVSLLQDFDKKAPVFLLGDFNINLLNSSNIYSKSFLSLLDTSNLTQVVKCPTHCKGSLLDLIIVDKSFPFSEENVTVDTLFRTDHYPIQMCLNFAPKPSPAKSVAEV